jgi:hypothetical protein
MLDFLYDNTANHEIVAELGDLSPFYQSLVDHIDSWLSLISKIHYNLLYFRPGYLFSELVSVLQVKDNFFHWQSSPNLWIFDSWLVD